MSLRKPKSKTVHRFAYEGLDRLIHERARLGILTSLLGHPKGLSFAGLKQLCGLTDGNLSRHLEVLDAAGLIEIHKSIAENRPHTDCRITQEGRRRFLAYLGVLEQVLLDAQPGGSLAERLSLRRAEEK